MSKKNLVTSISVGTMAILVLSLLITIHIIRSFIEFATNLLAVF